MASQYHMKDLGLTQIEQGAKCLMLQIKYQKCKPDGFSGQSGSYWHAAFMASALQISVRVSLNRPPSSSMLIWKVSSLE